MPLARRDGPVSLKSAALRIVKETCDTSPGDPEEGIYRSVYVSLYQNHAPRLVDAGIVEFDDENRLRLLRNDRSRDILRLMGQDFRDSWGHAYVTTILTAVTAGVLGGALLELGAGAIIALIVLSVSLAIVGIHQYLTSIGDRTRPWRIGPSPSTRRSPSR